MNSIEKLKQVQAIKTLKAERERYDEMIEDLEYEENGIEPIIKIEHDEWFDDCDNELF